MRDIKLRKTITSFSLPQQVYLERKAAFDAASAYVSAASAHLDWDGDFEAAFDAEEDIRTQVYYDDNYAMLTQAENNLIDWAKEIVQALPKSAKEAKLLTMLFDKLPTMPSIRARVIGLSMRLHVVNSINVKAAMKGGSK